MNKADILFYLTYGYFPNYKVEYPTGNINKIVLEGRNYDNLLEDFYKIFDNVIGGIVEKRKPPFIIPLSGGLDSRAILAGALKHLDPKDIVTYTFGIPGSYDYEIGKKVAKIAGVQHERVDLNNVQYTQEDLIEVAKRCDYQTVLFHHPPLYLLNKIIGSSVVLSGYIGDLIFGSYTSKAELNIEEVYKWYINKKYHSDYLLKRESSIEKVARERLWEIDTSNFVSPAEQMVLYERGPKLAAPHILMKGFEYETPLVDEAIMSFMFSLPSEYRLNERLFIDTMLKFYPKLFNIEAKTTLGFHLKSPKYLHNFARYKNKAIKAVNRFGELLPYPPLNYLNYDHAIVDRSDLRNIFESNLIDLKERGIVNDWLDPVKLYSEHKKSRNLSKILILLTSLEIILKAKSSNS